MVDSCRAKLRLTLSVSLGLGVWGSAASAGGLDFSRATMGRTTYPEGSWIVDTTQRYTVRRTGDPSGDTFRSSVELEHGQTERFSWTAGLETTDARRDRVQPGRGVLAARYMAVTAPLQVTPRAEYRPSLRRQAEEWELGFEALKNFERLSIVFNGNAQSSQEPGEKRLYVGSVMLGPLYRFGLNGIAGVQWVQGTDGNRHLATQVGGAVSKNIYLGVDSHFGLSRRAPDLQAAVKVHFYFGAYRRQAFGLAP
ncbi:MAG: hypothetical protein HY924_09315 [Elusimicrobia bacterium]|nr:hypothetical protein [Elusimicrobiota bacterium]